MTSNPLAELRFGFDLFSLMIVPLLSSNTDASQPYKINFCHAFEKYKFYKYDYAYYQDSIYNS
jgi:hypothetical protein